MIKIIVLGYAVLCIYFYGHVDGAESSWTKQDLDEAQLAPSELERDSSLTGSSREGPSDEWLARLSHNSGDEELFRRPLRNISIEGKRRRPIVRYLPLSPSFGKSIHNRVVRGETASFFDALYAVGNEPIILFRERRDDHQESPMKRQVAKVIQRIKAQRRKERSSTSEGIFSYDVDVAEPQTVKQWQEPDLPDTGSSEDERGNRPSGDQKMDFDIDWEGAHPQPTNQESVNWDQVNNALPQAMQQARQAYLQRDAAGGSNLQCPVSGPMTSGPGMIWAVSTHSPFSQFAYQREIAGRQLADQFAQGDTRSFMAVMRGKTAPTPPGECFEDRDVECTPNAPRNYDGTCVNPENPLYGSTNTAQTRMAGNSYEDSMSRPREFSVVSRIQNRAMRLPSSRQVSTAMSKNRDVESNKVTYLFNQMAQFVAHDLVLSPVERVKDPKDPSKSAAPKCCNQDPSCELPEPCFPIIIPDDDRVFAQFGKNCMEFVRSQPAAISGCRLADRIPLNSVTHWLDGSQIYGSKKDVANRLREFRKGLLKINNSTLLKGVVMVPGGPNVLGCVAPTPDKLCIMVGDARGNQHTGLVVTHTLWLREHNRVATMLHTLNPRASDEVIFHLARKIVIAEYQHIVYNELLVLILGKKVSSAAKNGVKLKESGYGEDCNVEVAPSIYTEFAASAFRFHTLSDNTLPVADEAGEEYPLTQHFLNPNMWYKEGMIDTLLRNLAIKNAEGFDPEFAFTEQNQVFKPVDQQTGIDMFAFNVQRGKDHGVATYTEMRKVCGLSRPRSFKDLEKIMDKRYVKSLASIYRHVDDIDMYPAGLAEKAINGDALVGGTFACVIAEQFKRLREADCNFYDKKGQFHPDALQEIRKVTLAGMLCANSYAYTDAQPRVLEVESEENRVTPCKEIQRQTTMNMKVFAKLLR